MKKKSWKMGKNHEKNIKKSKPWKNEKKIMKKWWKKLWKNKKICEKPKKLWIFFFRIMNRGPALSGQLPKLLIYVDVIHGYCVSGAITCIHIIYIKYVYLYWSSDINRVSSLWAAHKRE